MPPKGTGDRTVSNFHKPPDDRVDGQLDDRTVARHWSRMLRRRRSQRHRLPWELSSASPTDSSPNVGSCICILMLAFALFTRSRSRMVNRVRPGLWGPGARHSYRDPISILPGTPPNRLQYKSPVEKTHQVRVEDRPICYTFPVQP